MKDKIEEGCKAVIVREPKNLGKIVEVGKYIGMPPDVWVTSLNCVAYNPLGLRLWYVTSLGQPIIGKRHYGNGSNQVKATYEVMSLPWPEAWMRPLFDQPGEYTIFHEASKPLTTGGEEAFRNFCHPNPSKFWIGNTRI